MNARHPAVAQKVEWATVFAPDRRPLSYTIPCRRDGPPRVAELCSGAFGPFTAAARALGMDPVIEVDRDIGRINLLRATRQVIPGARVAHAMDLTDPTQWHRLVGAEIWAVGAPCQSTSNAGARRGANDPRDLSNTIWRLVALLRPPVIIVEVVPGIWNEGAHAQRLAGLAGQPYVAYACAIEASTLIPQNRLRGSATLVRLDVDGPKAEHLATSPWPAPQEGAPTVGAWHIMRRECPQAAEEAETLRITGHLLEALSPGERNTTWPMSRTYSRVLTQVSGTVMAAYGPPAGLPLPGYAQIVLDPDMDPPGYRWLRPRELARLQGLPEQVALTGTTAAQWKMIGDALPPVLAGLFLCKGWAILE